MNLEKVFNFWYFQEILENLPQIDLTQKNSYDKCNTFRVLTRFKRQELPSRIEDINFYPINFQQSGLIESPKDKNFYPFVQVYGGVIDYKKFLYDILTPVLLGFSRYSSQSLKLKDLKKDLDKLRKEIKEEEKIEKFTTNIKPLYSFSFFVSASGKYVFYLLSPGRIDGHPVPFFLIIPPIWLCLPCLLEKKSVKKEELLLVLETFQEDMFYDFLLKKGQIDSRKLLIQHYVLDFSFLMDLANHMISGSEKNKNTAETDFLPFVVKNNPGVKFYISERDIKKFKFVATKEKDNELEKEKAEISINMLRSLKKEYPKSLVIVPLEDCLKIAKKLEERYKKHSIIILSTDPDIIEQAERNEFHFSGIPRVPCVLPLSSPVDEKFVRDMFENFKKKISDENNLFKEILNKIQEPVEEIEEDPEEENLNFKNGQKRFINQKEIVFKAFILDKRRMESFHKVFEVLKNEIDNTFMFSFFMEDIEKARELYQRENQYSFTDLEGKLKTCNILKDYMEGNSFSKKVDSCETIEFLLDPDKIPLARWPVKEKIYPFFSQYLAIIAAYHHFLVEKEEKIISVNGPPGTGKTTLLKEYIANSLVCMAETVSKFIMNSSAQDLNLKKSKLNNLFKKLPEHSIIVASANNNAVLNVTKDLPTSKENPVLKEIIEKFLDISHNFTLIDWFYPAIENNPEEKTGRFIEKAVWICAAAISTDCFMKTFENKNFNSLEKIFIPLCKDPDLKELLKDCLNRNNNLNSSLLDMSCNNDFFCDQENCNYNVMLLAAPLGRADMTRPFFQTLINRFKKYSTGLKNSQFLKEMIKKNYDSKNNDEKKNEDKRKNRRVTFVMKSFLCEKIIPDFLNQKEKVKELKHKIKKYKDSVYNIRAIQKKLTEKETKIKELEDKKSDLNKKLELIKNKIKDNESKQKDLQTQKDNLASEIKSKESEIGPMPGLKSFLSFLFPKVKKLKKEIENLQVEIGKIEKSCESLIEKKSKLEKCQSKVEKLIKNLDTQISGIEDLKKTLKSYLKETEYEKRKIEKEFCPDYTPDQNQNDQTGQDQDNRMEKFFLPWEYVKKLEEKKKEEKEKFVPYASEILKKEQEKLFVAALRVLLYTAFTFSIEIQQNLKTLNQCIQSGEQNSSSISPASVLELWGSFFLLFPVVSTTFHSLVSRLFKNVELGTLGTFMIDEAGQGLPQMALGGLLRCKRAIVTGDPLQLEPVVAIPSSILKHLACCLNIDVSSYGFYLSGLERAVKIHNGYLDSSVQILADRASLYKGKIPLKEDQSINVGIPLRVHFRCDLNIMKVSNETTYGNTMVHFKSDPPEGEIIWYENNNNDTSQWINGHASISELKICLSQFTNLVTKEGFAPEDIFIISPFKTVAFALKDLFEEEFKNSLKPLFKDISLTSFLHNNVGTIHTFQGKEAKSVILVLGGKTPRAREWAAQKPNLLNVAVTRAKNKLIVIGKTENWKILDYFESLYQFSTIVN